MTKPYDAVGRDLLARHPNDWLPLFGLGRDLPVRAADSNVSTVTAEADVVLLVDGPDPGVLHLEFQSGYDESLPRRLFRYNSLLTVKHARPVCSAAVLLARRADGPGLRQPYEQSWPAGLCSVTFRFPVVRVWELPVADLLAAPGTAPLAPLAASVSEGDLPEVVRRVGEVFARETVADADVLWAVTNILMGLRFDQTLVSQLLDGVPGMKESVTYQAILQEGRAEGRVEGRAEGRVEGERASLIRLATTRFGTPDGATRARLEGLADEARLGELLDRVLTASSWEELLGGVS